jgi:hypothetical protein
LSDVTISGNSTTGVGGGVYNNIQLGTGSDLVVEGSAMAVDAGNSLRQIVSLRNASPSASVNTRIRDVYNNAHPKVLNRRSRDRFVFTHSKDVTNTTSSDLLN